MSKIDFWQNIWSDQERVLPTSNFAKRTYAVMAERGYKTVLDLGCGLGNDALYFARKGLDVTALDWSANALQRVAAAAEKEGLIQIQTEKQSLKNLQLQPNSYDAIYTHLSVHYFTDKKTEEIIAELHRGLRTGGTLFIKCKSVDDPQFSKGTETEPGVFVHNGYTRHAFSKEYMREKLRAFTILKLRRSTSVYYDYKASFIEAVAQK